MNYNANVVNIRKCHRYREDKREDEREREGEQ